MTKRKAPKRADPAEQKKALKQDTLGSSHLPDGALEDGKNDSAYMSLLYILEQYADSPEADKPFLIRDGVKVIL